MASARQEIIDNTNTHVRDLTFTNGQSEITSLSGQCVISVTPIGIATTCRCYVTNLTPPTYVVVSDPAQNGVVRCYMTYNKVYNN